MCHAERTTQASKDFSFMEKTFFNLEAQNNVFPSVNIAHFSAHCYRRGCLAAAAAGLLAMLSSPETR